MSEQASPGEERPHPVVAPSERRPVFVQLRDQLEEALRRGDYSPRQPIPSSRYLAQALGVSRGTVIAALDDLVARGLLVSRPRSGLYPVALVAPDAGHVEEGSPAPADPPSRVDWSSHLISTRDPWQRRKSVSDPDYGDVPYPFLAGQIVPGSFPARAWLRASSRIFDRAHERYATRDSVDADDPLLVEALTGHLLPQKGIVARPEQVLITSGAQQALALIAGALLDPGRTAAMETPGYLDAARIFHATGARLEFFDVDAAGVRADYEREFDLLFTTPSHQHPTNTTLSPARREEMLRQATLRDFLVIEDDFDSEIRYQGRPTPPMRASDASGRVIYLGTFSKFLAPSLRIGYVVAEEPIIEELRARRYLASKHPSGIDQRTLALFIESGDFQRVLRRHRTELRRSWTTMRDALAEHFPWPVEAPTGGLSFWVVGPEELDATVMARRARELGVLVSAGDRYHLRPDPPLNTFRLGFNSIPQARIAPGIRLLAQAVRETHPHLVG